jgi:YD repeat-containing protein
MFIERHSRKGFVLSEMIVVMGITTILSLAVMSFFMLSSRSFTAIFNYVDLDDANRICMDKMSGDIRQSNRVKSLSTNGTIQTLVLEDGDGNDLTYAWDGASRTITRTDSLGSQVALRNCDSLHFDLRIHTPVNGTLELYDAAGPATAKVVDVSWVCSRSIFGRKENTESVQTARIVIRKQR